MSEVKDFLPIMVYVITLIIFVIRLDGRIKHLESLFDNVNNRLIAIEKQMIETEKTILEIRLHQEHRIETCSDWQARVKKKLNMNGD
jgi:uncharacterized protein YoxC